VPLTQRACAVLTLWLAHFADAGPEAFVFPQHSVMLLKGGRSARIYAVRLDRAMGTWKTAWYQALKRAQLTYRWHDLRHTFVTRLAESPRISEETIRSLAGHVSQRMLQRYSHIRTEAKRQAIEHLSQVVGGGDGLQNWLQSEVAEPTLAS
jgi:integrase